MIRLSDYAPGKVAHRDVLHVLRIGLYPGRTRKFSLTCWIACTHSPQISVQAGA
jgi:hypothetical protein